MSFGDRGSKLPRNIQEKNGKQKAKDISCIRTAEVYAPACVQD